MTEKFNTTRNYSNYTDYSHFGGIIYFSDFETSYSITLSDIAARIISDQKFDERCRKNIENRKLKQSPEK